MKYQMPFNSLLNPGHSSCAGCGEILAMRHVLDAAGPNTIIVNATGCSEVTTSKFPTSSFRVPWIHANFENASAVASGVLAALENTFRQAKNQKIKKTRNQFTDYANFRIIARTIPLIATSLQ
jgi:pyruvate ferredoxin oxidoreductase beta subunit